MVRTVHRKPLGRVRMWKSMRILRRFTYPDLVATAEVHITNAKKYVMALRRCGIVTVDESSNYRRGRYQTMRLIIDLGPLTPRLQIDGNIFDPNAHGVYFEGGKFKPCDGTSGKSATRHQK